MRAPSLNADCLKSIFKLLDQPAMLRSCLLVNKDWRNVAVGFLWHDMRRMVDKGMVLRPVAETLVRCLHQQEEQQALLDLGLTSSSFPTFDYTQTVRVVALDELYNQLCDWMLEIIKESNALDYNMIERAPYYRGLLKRERLIKGDRLCQLILDHCGSIRELVAGSSRTPYIPQNMRCFQNLVQLSWKSDNCDGEFLRQLGSVACRLESFDYEADLQGPAHPNVNGLNDAFKSLVASQHRLRRLKVVSKSLSVQAILAAIQSQAAHLRSVHLDSVHFPPATMLPRTPYLEVLELTKCHIFSSGFFRNLLTVPTCPLTFLRISATTIPAAAVKPFVIAVGNSLITLRLSLKGNNFLGNKDMVRIAASHAPYLEDVMFYVNDNVNELAIFMTQCSRLRSLGLFSVPGARKPVQILFERLIELRPRLKRLQRLLIPRNWVQPVKSLEQFLITCEPPLDKLEVPISWIHHSAANPTVATTIEVVLKIKRTKNEVLVVKNPETNMAIMDGSIVYEVSTRCARIFERLGVKGPPTAITGYWGIGF